MALTSNWISQALSPGIALSATIFYNSSLQTRFVYITGKIRELNREARELRDRGGEKAAERIASIRLQVEVMTIRAGLIRRGILILLMGFLTFITTILLLGVGAAFELRWVTLAAYALFCVGFLSVIGAALLQIRELYMGHRTIVEDTRTSFE